MVVYTQIALAHGMIFLTTLNSFMPWRMIAMIYSFVCFFTTITLGFESCFFSLSSNYYSFQIFQLNFRSQIRLRSGCYQIHRVRKIAMMPKNRFVGFANFFGLVPKFAAAQEFWSLQVYSQRLNSCDSC